MIEKFKPIKDYEGLYEISNFGCSALSGKFGVNRHTITRIVQGHAWNRGDAKHV